MGEAWEAGLLLLEVATALGAEPHESMLMAVLIELPVFPPRTVAGVGGIPTLLLGTSGCNIVCWLLGFGCASSCGIGVVVGAVVDGGVLCVIDAAGCDNEEDLA